MLLLHEEFMGFVLNGWFIPEIKTHKTPANTVDYAMVGSTWKNRIVKEIHLIESSLAPKFWHFVSLALKITVIWKWRCCLLQGIFHTTFKMCVVVEQLILLLRLDLDTEKEKAKLIRSPNLLETWRGCKERSPEVTEPAGKLAKTRHMSYMWQQTCVNIFSLPRTLLYLFLL